MVIMCSPNTHLRLTVPAIPTLTDTDVAIAAAASQTDNELLAYIVWHERSTQVAALVITCCYHIKLIRYR